MSYKQNVGFCRVLYYRPALFIAFYKMDTFVKHNFGLMICNFFNKVRFLTNKLKLLIFMKKPFLHLHLSLLFLMGCVFLLPSCIEDKAEDAAHRLVVSKVDVELIQTGMLNTGSKASFDVLANRGYVITSDAEWLDVDKPTGKGRVSVTLEAKPNETAGERTGHLTVTSGKLSERVTVTQTLDPDPDDGNPVGYTYYSENFDWIAVYGGADCVGLGSQNGAKNIYSTGAAKIRRSRASRLQPRGQNDVCLRRILQDGSDRQTDRNHSAGPENRPQESLQRRTHVRDLPEYRRLRQGRRGDRHGRDRRGAGHGQRQFRPRKRGHETRPDLEMDADERETLRRDCCDPYRHPLDAAGESRCDRRRKRLFPLVSRQREDRESSAQLTAINSKSE